MDAGVVRQDLIEVGRDHGEGGGRGAVVEVGVADVAALDQRSLDFSAGDGGQRASGNGGKFAGKCCAAAAAVFWTAGETVAVVTETSL